MTGELVTVECGHYANFVGAHWWNQQEASFCYDGVGTREPREIRHECTFREGLTLTGEQTYTPRLIAIDLPGEHLTLVPRPLETGNEARSLKTLKVGGALYQMPPDGSLAWEGAVEEHQSAPPAKNQFLTDLESIDAQLPTAPHTPAAPKSSEVEVWSDFLRLHLHPKSLLTVPGHFHNNPQNSFHPFPAGLAVWEDRKFREELEDRVHFFVEECDHLQGFQLLVDWEGGFSALASSFLQQLTDEFPSKTFLALLTDPRHLPLDKADGFGATVLSHALGLDAVAPLCSLLCPSSPCLNPWCSTGPQRPHPPGLLGFEPALPYHRSAVLAAAVDSVSLLHRSEHSNLTLPFLCDTLTAGGRKVCSLAVRLPFPLPADSSVAAELDAAPLHSSLHPLSPFSAAGDVCWSQACVLRGCPSSYPLCSSVDPGGFRHPSHVLAAHLAKCSPSINSLCCTVEEPLSLAPPFPSILPPAHPSGTAAVCASLRAESGTHRLLTSLCQEAGAAWRHRPPSLSSLLDADSLAELLQNLGSLAECYRTCHAPEPSDSD